MSRAKTVFLFLVILAALSGALYLWKYGEWVAIPKAREHLISLLRDPSSAQTRNERITTAGVLCGEVNAKNGMGGYIGFRKFISYGPNSNYVEGSGLLNEESVDDFIARVQQKTEILKAQNARFEQGKVESTYSERELDDMATERIFRDKWNESCASTHA